MCKNVVLPLLIEPKNAPGPTFPCYLPHFCTDLKTSKPGFPSSKGGFPLSEPDFTLSEGRQKNTFCKPCFLKILPKCRFLAPGPTNTCYLPGTPKVSSKWRGWLTAFLPPASAAASAWRPEPRSLALQPRNLALLLWSLVSLCRSPPRPRAIFGHFWCQSTFS